MLRRTYFFLIAFLLNVRPTLALLPPSPIPRPEAKIEEAISWIGMGAQAAGVVAIIFGGFQLGMSFSSDDPGNRNKALMFLACGLVLFMAPSIIMLFMGWKIISF